MGKNSGVPWTDHSWSPWYGGCSPRGPECAECYARREMKRYGKDPEVLTRSSRATFRGPLRWHEPALVFVCPWSDFFLPEADAWRPEVWAIMRDTPHLRYIIPTKRPELIPDRLPPDWGAGYPNVCLLVSAGTYESARRFIPPLLEIPAACRGLSAEPLLEWLPLAMDTWTVRDGFTPGWLKSEHSPNGLEWLIIGAESRGNGPGRPCPLEAVERLVARADDHGLPVFVKQLHIDGRLSKDPEDWPAHLRRQEFPAFLALPARASGAGKGG